MALHLRHWCIVEKGKDWRQFGRNSANNCDSDVSNPRRTGYIKYHWTDIGCSNVYEPVTKRFTSLVHKSQDGSALNPTWSVSGTIIL